MKKINFIKFALDLVMGIVFALLFNTRVLGGMNFHEIAGLAIGFAILVHVLLNWKWVKNVTLSIFNKKLALKTRIGYVLNILLLLDMLVIIISGLFISKVLFPSLRMQSSFFNRASHTSASYIALVLIGIHLGLHWKWVVNVTKKIIGINSEKKVFGYIAKVLAALVLAFGIYSMISVNYFSNTVQIFKIGTPGTFQHEKGKGADFELQAPGENDNSSSDMTLPKDFSQNFKDGRGGKPGFPGGERGMRDGKGMGSANVPRVIVTYISIMGVFTVFSYYTEKLLIKGKSS